MRLERSTIRRDANRPELAQGDRTVIELDPDKVRLALIEFRRSMKALERLLNPRPARRRLR